MGPNVGSQKSKLKSTASDSGTSPLAGAVYVLGPERVHPLDVPFTVAIKSISRWGAGCRDLVGTLTPSRETAHSRP